MDLETVFNILLGSTFGLILRLFIQYKVKTKAVFYCNNLLIINVLASFFLGIFIALNSTNKGLTLLFFVGFLGCLSTFSSFIYQLFNLIRKKKYLSLIIYYIEIFVLSFSFFCLGHFIALNFLN